MKSKILTALLAAAVVMSAAAASAGTPVKIGYAPRLPQTPIFIADKKGFFKEEGLDVELVAVNSATTVLLPMIAKGDLQLSFSGPTATLFNALSQGMNIKIVADGGSCLANFDGCPYVIVARKDLHDEGKLTKLSDFKGQTVSFGADGTSLAYMMFRALEKAGLKDSDVTLRWFTSVADMGVALSNKALAASAMIAPFDASLAQKGIAVRLSDAREVAPGMQTYMVIASEQFVQNKDALERFRRAYKKAILWYKKQIGGDDTELTSIVSEYTKMTPAQIKASSWGYYADDLKVNTQDISTQYDLWVKRGIAKPGLDIKSHVIESAR